VRGGVHRCHPADAEDAVDGVLAAKNGADASARVRDVRILPSMAPKVHVLRARRPPIAMQG
jgi:hypothetical protein